MYRKFIGCFLVTAVLLSALAGSLNYLIDPYSIRSTGRQQGWNLRAFKAESVERMGKMLGLLRLTYSPEVICIGSSQVHWGFDADGFREITGKTAYNLGVRGMSAYEQRRYVEHVLAVSPGTREIILSLDFTKYISGPRYQTPADESFRQEEGQVGVSHVTAENLARTVFSYQALCDSMETVRENHAFNWGTPYYTESATISDDAMLAFFEREHWSFDRSMDTVQKEGWLEEPRLNEASLQELVKITDLCREHDVRLRLYIPPMHGEAMAAYMPCLDVYGTWLKRVSALAPVWNFAHYDRLSLSQVAPGSFSAATNTYFWDSIHHKHNVSNMIFAEMYSVDRGEMPSALGSVMTPAEVDAYLDELRAGFEAWSVNGGKEY